MKQNVRCGQELDAIFSGLEREFSKGSRAISAYDKDLEEQVSHIAQAAKRRSVGGKLREDHPLLAHYAAMRSHIERECDEWVQNVRKNHRNSVFRDKFNDSMLVYVYGKVKSAKSSLGNFLAYGKHDPTPEDVNARPAIEFDVERISDAADDDASRLEKQRAATRKDRKFLVDFFEATACIQYFKKPGFTWIDSPGIHSTTGKNGKLAADYLESADLVVYTMSSRSTARETDRQEIRRIIQSGKRLLLLVTRCDEIIKDEDAETHELINVLTMLSPEDRKEIRDGSIASIMEDLGPDAPAGTREMLEKNTVTLSVRYAEAHPEDPGWSESGVPDFYAVLGNVARSEGVRLKMQAPIRAILHHVRQMQHSVGALKTKQGDMEARLRKARSTLEQQAHTLAMNVGMQLDHDIVSIARQYTGDDRRFQRQVTDLAEKALENTSAQLAKTIAADTVALTANLPRQSLKTENLPSYEDIYQTITYHTTSKKRGGTLLGAIAGGVAGFLAAGPAGAAIGAGLGSTAGGLAGSAFDGSQSSRVKVGDNSLEVGRAAARAARDWLEASLTGMSEDMAKECLDPLQNWLAAMRRDMESFETFLSDTRMSLEKELEA